MPSYASITFSNRTLVKRFLVILFFSMAFWGPPAYAEVVNFALSDANGVEHKLSDYRGKWLVINFWATWCAPCLKEIPELIQFHNRHKDNDAIVLGIDFEEIDLTSLRAFIKEQGMNYPVLRAGSTSLAPFEPLLGLPSTFLVSPQGMYVDKHMGPITLAQLEEFLAKNKDAANSTPPTFSRREIYLGVATFTVLLLVTGAYAYRRMSARHRQNMSLYK
jgi:thiol-disulfide isomerase/thioredoxin